MRRMDGISFAGHRRWLWQIAQPAPQSGNRAPTDTMENLLKKLDLTSLRLFVAVCQERNIARAAEREFIASSAVSRRIADIEAMIGLPVPGVAMGCDAPPRVRYGAPYSEREGGCTDERHDSPA